MKKGFILSFGTLSILNETDDDDASQSRQTGPKVSFSVGKTKFKQCSFPDRRTTFSLHLISYDDGLIDSGKFIGLYDL